MTNFKERRKSDAKGRKILMKSVVPAKPEKEVDCVLADASHRSLELVQDVPQLRDGAIQRFETKANSPRIENPIYYKAAKSEAVLNAPFLTLVAGRKKNIEALTQSPLNNKLEADIKFI